VQHTDEQQAAEVNAYLQQYMRRRGLHELDAVTANALLEEAGILRDSTSRPGTPLCRLLRAGLIGGARQVPPKRYGAWLIELPW
jgi:hypothetical protein